jgi:L-iditol 2-dehydrogenase
VSHPTKVSADVALPEQMRTWVLGDPGRISLVDKLIPVPGRAEVLVRLDAVVSAACRALAAWTPR